MFKKIINSAPCGWLVSALFVAGLLAEVFHKGNQITHNLTMIYFWFTNVGLLLCGIMFLMSFALFNYSYKIGHRKPLDDSMRNTLLSLKCIYRKYYILRNVIIATLGFMAGWNVTSFFFIGVISAAYLLAFANSRVLQKLAPEKVSKSRKLSEVIEWE